MTFSNVAVVGSAAAFASSLLSSTSVNNSAYFINMFNTLAEREDTVLIEAKTFRRRYHERYDQCVDPPGRGIYYRAALAHSGNRPGDLDS